MTAQTYISLGGGLRLVAESYYVEALGNGMTVEAFRAWCACIGVRMVEIGDTRYINPHQLETHVAGLMSKRSPYQVIRVPGCESIIRDGEEPTILDDGAIAAIGWRDVVHELIAWRKLNGSDTGASSRERLKEVARTLAMDVIAHRPDTQS